MSMVVVLFNLKPGIDPAEYEAWARSTDLPSVNALASVKQFTVLKAGGLLGGGAAPYEYVELIDVQSVEDLRADTQSATMQAVAQRFRQFADAPTFILTESLE
jgi:hypothetical protein